VEDNDPRGGDGQICEGDRARVGVRSNYCVLGGCLLSLSWCLMCIICYPCVMSTSKSE